VGGASVAEVERLGRAAQPYEVPVFTPASLAPKLTSPNVFSLTPGLATYGIVLARFATKELRASPVAVLTDSRLPAAGPLIEAFVEESKREPGLRLTSWEFKNEVELQELAEPLSKLKPAAVLYSGTLADLARLRSRLKDPALRPVWLLASAAVTGASPAGQDGSAGLAWASLVSPDDASPFAKAYASRFREPPAQPDMLAYDAIRVIVEALVRARKVAGSRLRDEVLRSDPPFECSTGTLTFDAEQNARRPLFIVQSKDGKTALLKRYDPDPR
jgi:ABC-type branched-subunit amino acid transport system substrate-binding protein